MKFDLNQRSLPNASPSDLAGYILAKLGPTPHLKLQKLVFYIEAFHLAFFEESLIGEDFEAWVHGPVCKSLYNELKVLNPKLYSKFDLSESVDKKALRGEFEGALSDEQVSLIEDVLKQYGKLNAYELESLTHSEKPWIEARAGLSPAVPSARKIKKTTMKDFYRAKLANG